MRNNKVRCRKGGLAALFILLLGIQAAHAVSGYAITAAKRQRFLDKEAVPEQAMSSVGRGCATTHPGKIIRITIENNQLVSTDTIYKETFARYPTFNLDGTRIAFFRYSAYIGSDGNLVNGDGPRYLSIMNVDGSNVKDIVEVSSSDDYGALEWPVNDGGNWLYYRNQGTQEIWKVNTEDPSTNQLVWAYGSSRKWELSADGTKAIIQGASAGQGSYPHGYGNVPHLFPPTTQPHLDNITGEKPGGCNGAISPSGDFIARFSGGAHVKLFFHRYSAPNHIPWEEMRSSEFWPTWQGSNWNSTVDIEGKQDWPRWSCNSDKWIASSITASKEHGGVIGGSNTGGNQCLVNWVDKIAIKTTYNKVGDQYTQDKKYETRYWATAGDFYVKGVPSGCYEDSSGNFINALTRETVEPSEVVRGQSVSQSRDPHQAWAEAGAVVFGSHARRSVRIFDLHGAVVFSGVTEGHRIDVPSIKRGQMLVVSVTAPGLAPQAQKLVVR